jgi:hypothetical protein
MGARHTKQGDCQIAQRSHDLSAVCFADAAAVFIEGNIADIMEAVFDRPVAAAQTEQAGGVGFVGWETGDAVDGFGAVLLSDDLGGVALDGEDLGGIGKSEIASQFGTGPDVADFESSMSFIDGGMVRGEKPPSRGRRCLGGGWIGCL